MSNLNVSDKLRGDLGEVYFEHFSEKSKWAHITSEEIYRQLTGEGKLIMRLGYKRIEVTLPRVVRDELFKWCQPSRGEDGSPAFTCDYFTITLNGISPSPDASKPSMATFEYVPAKETWVQRGEIQPGQCKWIEVKTGKSQLSKNQEAMVKETKLQMAVFRIKSDPPANIDVEYEWLNGL